MATRLLCDRCGHSREISEAWLEATAKVLGVAPKWVVAEIYASEAINRLICGKCRSKHSVRFDFDDPFDMQRAIDDYFDTNRDSRAPADPGKYDHLPVVEAFSRPAKRRCRGCDGWAVYGDDLCLKCAGN